MPPPAPRRVRRATDTGLAAAMGAWGVESFENDDAQDWIGELEAQGLDAVRLALAKVTDDDGHRDAGDCCRALAAAEILAALAGRPPRYLPRDAEDWLAAHPGTPPPGLLAAARRAVDRVATDSELRHLWEEPHIDTWRADVAGLRARLDAVTAAR